MKIVVFNYHFMFKVNIPPISENCFFQRLYNVFKVLIVAKLRTTKLLVYFFRNYKNVNN